LIEPIKTILILTVLGIILAICIAFYRLVKGPTAPDRVIAGDMMANLATAVVVILSIYYEEAMLLDIAILLAILGFIGTLAISKYVEGRGVGD